MTHCKLGKKAQPKLVEFFIFQVVAHLGSDVIGIQANSATLALP